MLSKYHKVLKENYLKRKNDIYYSLESNEVSTAEEDNLKPIKDKKIKKNEEISKTEQISTNFIDQTNFRRYVMYSHENRGIAHDDKENVEGGSIGKNEKDMKNSESGYEENELQVISYLESAAKYFRNCILLLKNKYKSENIVFSESKYEIKVEKNERKGSGEENKEAEVNKFSEKYEKFLYFYFY